jgi:hypothetical protein
MDRDVEQLLHAAYAAFNARDIDGALAVMTPDVDWPNVAENRRVVGHASAALGPGGRARVKLHSSPVAGSLELYGSSMTPKAPTDTRGPDVGAFCSSRAAAISLEGLARSG